MSKNKRSTKFLASAVPVATAVALVAAPSASANELSFTDVSAKYLEAVNFLVGTEMTNGFSETQFGTDSNILRVDAAVLIAKALDFDEDGSYEDAGFTDVPSRATWAVNALVEEGILKGKTATKFGAADDLTRNEAASMIAKAANLSINETLSTTQFTDVNKRFSPYVQALLEEEITAGKSATKFGAEDPVKRGELAQFINSAKEHFGFFDLMVMHMNDTHAYLENFPYAATAVKELREEYKNNLLLNAGDVFSGDLYFNAFEGQADLELMNYMGFDAMVFGNHEFDLGSSEDGHKALSEFVKAAEFPLVAANVDFSKDALFDSLQTREVVGEYEDGEIYNGVVIDVNGEKVGVFGLTTEETPFIASTNEVEFSNYIEEAEAAVAAFEELGVDKIIALTHLGFNDSIVFDNDMELAKQVEGIDIIVGGHTHYTLAEPYVSTEFDAPTLIVQANEYAKYLGALDVTFNKDGEVILYQGELLSTEAGKTEFAADPEALEILAPYKAKVEQIKNDPIGVDALVKLDASRDDDASGKPSIRHSEMNLGNLIAEGLLYSAQQLADKDTVIALQNGGGIRTSIDEGPITVGDVLKVLPFGNGLATVTLTGAEIIEVLEHAVSADLREDGGLKENGGFLQIAGMKYTYDSSEAVGSRVQEVFVNIDEEFVALNTDENYVVATNIFTAKGGDGFDTFKKAYEDGRVSEPGFSDYQNLIDYMQTFEEGISTQVDNRIVNLALTEEQ
ncbi:5'-nucleotidase C-terminal domain-containing protein [Sporosarcina sp. G11-34]|uniref:5'-nucleotidase C-terminal domain-containing protein n=1 Tax=Sporosarcina sp. G11-34 TaxID=2849605 RepID=UPI0022A93519|nr:5'-nucleotidase C-terminal domain-containing protein [Sporosarcina sp. G11-34]MCZ2257567.1 5'-nucleotidase C-terminal domain-containing protein [Sporosarcina sp. G11-34]